ncbi:MAG: hypothetical protein ACFB50_00220 [Rubrobacteraceae bacterium]
MSEERPTRRSFFTRMFAPEEEGEETMVFSTGDIELEDDEPEVPLEKPQGLTVERAAQVIRNIPGDVPSGSAVPIVRFTLEAAGISMRELGTSIRARESKLDSVIEQRQSRIRKLREDTEKAVRYKEQEIRALEEDIKKFRQARDNGISQEQAKISQARAGIEEVELVRSFFDLPEEEEEPALEEPEPDQELPPAEDEVRNEETAASEDLPHEEPEDSTGDETQILERPAAEEEPDMDDTQVLRRPGPLSENWDTRERREP